MERSYLTEMGEGSVHLFVVRLKIIYDAVKFSFFKKKIMVQMRVKFSSLSTQTIHRKLM